MPRVLTPPERRGRESAIFAGSHTVPHSPRTSRSTSARVELSCLALPISLSLSLLTIVQTSIDPVNSVPMNYVTTILGAENSPPPKQRKSNAVYHSVKRAILLRRLEPGQAPLEQQIMAAMGCSQGTVREALLRLEQDGLGDAARLPRHGRVDHLAGRVRRRWRASASRSRPRARAGRRSPAHWISDLAHWDGVIARMAEAEQAHDGYVLSESRPRIPPDHLPHGRADRPSSRSSRAARFTCIATPSATGRRVSLPTTGRACPRPSSSTARCATPSPRATPRRPRRRCRITSRRSSASGRPSCSKRCARRPHSTLNPHRRSDLIERKSGNRFCLGSPIGKPPAWTVFAD